MSAVPGSGYNPGRAAAAERTGSGVPQPDRYPAGERVVWRFDGRHVRRSPWRDVVRTPAARPRVDPHDLAARLRARAERERTRILFPNLRLAADLERQADHYSAWRVFRAPTY